jgi:predicted O-methyltransferase YrrM
MHSPQDLINSFLQKIDYADQPEGSSIPQQIVYYIEFLLRNPHIKTVVEIGFNLGVSAAAFLAARPDIHVLSVDIGAHTYVLAGKRNIDAHFPGRHTLVIGDSTTTVPFLHTFFGQKKVDLFMVDGYHVEPTPRIDLSNALAWCGPESYIIVDDVCEAWGNEGVNQALRDAIAAGSVEFIEHKTAADRGWALLKRGPNAPCESSP